jgi:RNA polymerase sigma-70 factor, ECF subfamily
VPGAISYLCREPAADKLLVGAWAASVSDDHLSEFERRLRECHRIVYHVAFGVLRDATDAEEITQDAFLRAYRKLSSLREPQKFRSWVARMSFRLALNRRRATERARRRDTSWLEMRPSSTGNVETIVAQREFQLRLQQEIDRLPEKLRVVLLLTAVKELNTRDIADMLGIPEGTVRSRLYLARKELSKVFCDEAL